jgi:hypothetical protein
MGVCENADDSVLAIVAGFPYDAAFPHALNGLGQGGDPRRRISYGGGEGRRKEKGVAVTPRDIMLTYIAVT